MHAPFHHRRVQMMRARHDVRDDLGLRRIGNARFEDADDGGRAVSEPDRFSDHRRVALQRGGPEAMGEHGGARRPRAVIGRVEQAAPLSTQAHDLEIRSADDARADHTRFAQADHREIDRREVAECRERLDARLQVAELRDRKLGVLDADAARALMKVDEAVLVAVHERAQKNAPDDAEDGGVGADAERERDDHSGDQAFDPGERSNGETKIADEIHRRDSALYSLVERAVRESTRRTSRSRSLPGRLTQVARRRQAVAVVAPRFS